MSDCLFHVLVIHASLTWLRICTPTIILKDTANVYVFPKTVFKKKIWLKKGWVKRDYFLINHAPWKNSYIYIFHDIVIVKLIPKHNHQKATANTHLMVDKDMHHLKKITLFYTEEWHTWLGSSLSHTSRGTNKNRCTNEVEFFNVAGFDCDRDLG